MKAPSTAFFRPEYDFPGQDEVISRTVELVKEYIRSRPRTVVMVGAYLIGKERVMTALASELGCRVWGEPDRVQTWHCLGDHNILDRVTSNRGDARLQVFVVKHLTIYSYDRSYMIT